MAASGIDAATINAVYPPGHKYAGQPIYSARVKADFASAAMQAALNSGGSTKVKIGNTEYTVTGGKVTAMKTGGVVKPILAAAAVAGTAGVAGAFLGGGTAAGAGGATGATGATGAAGASAGGLGLTSSELVRYGLPVAGNLVAGYLQSRAAGNASEAQQKYLEEALAYEKEKDAYARKYQAESDTYNRGIDAEAVAREEKRYGNYQGRIAPFIGTGTAANSRMATLLGLPEGSYGAGGGGSAAPAATERRASAGPTGPIPKTTGDVAKDLEIANKLGYGGTHHVDPSYWIQAGYAKDPQYFFEKMLGKDATGKDAPTMGPYAPGGGTPAAATTPPTSPGVMAPPRDATAPSGPVGSSAMVSMRAPDGSIKTVPQNQVAFYQQKGAVVLQGAA